MEEDLDELLAEHGIEDVDLIEDDLDHMYVLPTPEERPTWMD